MSLEMIRDLYSHMEWADAAVWSAILTADDARTDDRLRDLYYHAHLVQLAFLHTWRGEAMPSGFPTFEELPSLLSWGRGVHDRMRDYVAGLDDEELSRSMPVAWAKLVEQRLGRAPVATTRGETLLQVATHSAYHRGQINARLRELRGVPPPVDYIYWLWLGRPGAEWPG